MNSLITALFLFFKDGLTFVKLFPLLFFNLINYGTVSLSLSKAGYKLNDGALEKKYALIAYHLRQAQLDRIMFVALFIFPEICTTINYSKCQLK
jgi:hypothetical protein